MAGDNGSQVPYATWMRWEWEAVKGINVKMENLCTRNSVLHVRLQNDKVRD